MEAIRKFPKNEGTMGPYHKVYSILGSNWASYYLMETTIRDYMKNMQGLYRARRGVM